MKALPVSKRKRSTGPNPASFEEELDRGYEREFASRLPSDELQSDEADVGEADSGEPSEGRSDGAFDRGLGESAAPESVDEALARALRHGRAATAEVLATGRALLDAVALATRGSATDEDPLLGPLAQLLTNLEARLATDRGDPASALIGALADALDTEIGHWEERARNDAEARAVLRAFLGVREILWEFGVRNAGPNNKGETETKAPKPDGSGKPRRSAKKRPRVQRVRVEG